MDDIRVTWRGRGNARGDEDTGIRVVIPLSEAGPPAPVVTPVSATSNTTSNTKSGNTESGDDTPENAFEF
jgi:hypothetical protein